MLRRRLLPSAGCTRAGERTPMLASTACFCAAQQLMAAEAQLDSIKHNEKAKSKGLLISMAEGKETALVHAVFSSWLGYMEKCQAEKEIRQRFQGQIDACKDSLTAYKAAQMENVKGVIMRG